MRYFLFSTIVHLLLIFGGIVFAREGLDFQMVGDPTITMSMVGESSQAGGRAEDLSLGKPAAAESKPKPAKPKKKKKAVKEKPEVVKREVKKEAEVPVEEVIPEKIVEEKIEKPVETEEIEVTEDEISDEVSDETVDTDTTEESQVTDEESTEESETTPVNESNSRAVEGSQEMGEGFVQLDDGAWAAKNQGVKGLSYGFLAQPEPEYPAIARKMGVNHEVVIKVRFLIGYNGRVEDIKFYDDVTNFGFREVVVKTLKNWRATPIEVDGKKIKLYFYKTFRFEKLG